MKILSKTVVAGLSALMFLAFGSEPAEARELDLTEPGLPFVYRYASCVFEAQARLVTDCSEIRTAVEREAENVFEDWHRGNILSRRRQFSRALDLIEAEARELASAGGMVPRPIILYLRCLGEGISTDQSFIEGRSIDYVSLEETCTEQVNESYGGSSEWRGHYLYHRLRRDGRVINVALDSLPTITFQHGLLDIRRLVSRHPPTPVD